MTSGGLSVVYLGSADQLVELHIKKIVGEVLTQSEVILPEGSSRNAFKSVIKQAIWRNATNLRTELTSLSFIQEMEERHD
jgi:hypothetical protein|tara:strand:- start:591 stop:830 length:240 start_codon:yes stop_codon:yes gene_type:complete